MPDKLSVSVPIEAVLAAEKIDIDRRRRDRFSPLPPAEYDFLTGLALSGGGIRSAAVCLGAIQALRTHDRLNTIDYLSTVSGGGYTGACLSAAMSADGGHGYPFGDDVEDSPVVGHIRNYSNYLLPRSRSAIRNWTEAAAIILRGLLANAVCVLAFLLPAVWLTAVAFPDREQLSANFIPHLFGLRPSWPFVIPAILAGVLAAALLIWAMARSWPRLDRATDDTSSRFLSVTHVLLAIVLLALAIDLQPVALKWLATRSIDTRGVQVALSAMTTFMGAVAALASSLGKFLHTTSRSQNLITMGLRLATRAALVAAALVLPLLIWLGYFKLYFWVIDGAVIALPWAWGWLPRTPLGLVVRVAAVCWAIMLCLRPNGYSLHRLYRDRLSKAFLVSANSELPVTGIAKLTRALRRLVRIREKAAAQGDLPPLDTLKLSNLMSSNGPYPLINAALNVQGSREANKRGRNADFFVFTPQYVGSDLTRYAPVEWMEKLDSRLDLATAMAISGAAASANMGGATVRVLSPTLSLLNVRLGYYLTNPRYVGTLNTVARWWQRTSDRFYLFVEMLNGLTEKRGSVYLTDGGHIENLGIYSLLKRRCGLIVAIDSEADPELSCQSLLKLERFARIDEGIRIVLPWEEIARNSRKAAATLSDESPVCDHGPHCAIGKILYPDGASGMLVYVKSSLSGDEKDYILDYAKRNPSFPHETTGDQFFSEEQFEMYRALGFHMMDGVFGTDRLAFLSGSHGFASEAEARAALNVALPAALRPVEPPKSPAKRK